MLFHPSLNELKLSPIKAMELAASKVPGAISLAQGIPSFNTPELIKDFVIEKIRGGSCDKYSVPLGLVELREELALSLEKEGLHYDPEKEIVVTAGAIEGITASILAFTSPGDEIIIPSPTYTSYIGAVRLARCVPVFSELDEDNNFDFRVDKIASAITRKTKLILYSSPNNPTGTIFSEAKTVELLKLAQEHGIMVVVDEVYKDFYYSNDKHFSPVQYLPMRHKVVRICSFSKAFAMTGWRVGFVHGEQTNMQQLLKVHDTMVTCAPVVSQYAALAALRFGEPFVRNFCLECKKRRDITIQTLDQLSRYLDYQVPKATYFVFPRIKDTVPLARDSTALAYDILEKAKVALVPGVAFGPSGESHLRINFGRDEADLKTALERVSEYFSGATKKQLKNNREIYLQRRKGLVRIFAEKILGLAAKIYIKRNRPVVIGLVGFRGKTVGKRLLAELLGSHIEVRASTLSYNTEIGLPLSILDVSHPRLTGSYAHFLLKILVQALFGREKAKILILEFGIGSRADAQMLSEIVRPDWVIVTGLGDETTLGHEAYRGLEHFLKKIPSDKVIWNGDEPLLEELKLNWCKEFGFSISAIEGETLSAHERYKLGRELVGDNQKLLTVASVRLAEELKVPRANIERFLEANQ